jgi:phosphoribosylformimino-5-aminoimidazole carboxamide ribotide isomerase
MIIFPAIDLKDGKCVRLTQGDYDRQQIFSDDPTEMALKWQFQGAEYLHLVDLGGALTGVPENLKVIKSIVKVLRIPIQLGGGIRNMKYAEELLDLGVSRIILGTSALKDRAFTIDALNKFGGRIAVSLDARHGLLAAQGWTETSEIKAADLANELKNYGLETVIYTDIAKDGMMAGPNFSELIDLQKSTDLQIVASGGISTMQQLADLSEMNFYGAIVGKALYTGDIELSDYYNSTNIKISEVASEKEGI